MNHPLIQRVEQIRRQAERVVWLHAIGWFGGLVILSSIAISLLDFAIRPNELGLRVMLSLAVATITVWAARRWLAVAWRYQLTNTETAQRIENRFPELAGRLSSSVSFLSDADDNPAGGSMAMKRRVVAETQAATERLPFNTAINQRPQSQGMLLLLTGIALLGMLAMRSPALLSIGIVRLAMPWSSHSWPRWTYLQFIEVPSKVARGEALELVVADQNGKLPSVVTIDLRYIDGEQLSHPMKQLKGQAIERIENITRSFSFRATGGDDDTMPWQSVEVVEPIAVTSSSITITPPAYAGPPRPALGELLTILAGSSIQLQVQVDRPLQSARIIRSGDHKPIQLALDESGHQITLGGSAWLPIENETDSLEIVGQDGVTMSDVAKWTVRLTPDTPPNISLQVENSYATPLAELPVVGSAKDDLALSRVELCYLVSGNEDQTPVRIELWQAKSNPLLKKSRDFQTNATQAQNFAGTWSTETIAGIEAGQTIDWWLEASDFKPQIGQTSRQKLFIVSSDELRDRLGQRYIAALTVLSEALQSQREARDAAASVKLQWDEVGTMRSQDRDLLLGSELRQRQVRNLCGRTPTGASTTLASILESIAINRLETTDLIGRCEQLLVAIDELEKHSFKESEEHLANLLREVRAAQTINPQAAEELTRLLVSQHASVETLERLLNEMSQWNQFQQLRAEVVQVRQAERDLIAQTRLAQNAMVAIAEVGAQQRADARQVGQRQSDLLRRFGKIIERLTVFAKHESDPGTAKTAQSAIAVVEETAIAEMMREAARSADALRLGEALQREQTADEGLTRLLDALSGKKADAKPSDNAQQLNSDLAQLSQKQEALRAAFEQQAKASDPKVAQADADKQNALASETSKVAQSLQAHSAAAASAASSAAAAMKRAAEAAKSGDAESASQHAKEAKKRLDEAREAATQQKSQDDANQLAEKLLQLQQQIGAVAQKQEAALNETQKLLKSVGNTDGDLEKVTELSQLQNALAVETRALSTQEGTPDAFEFGLSLAADEMSSAGQQLVGENKLPAALAIQKSALERLLQMVAALEAEANAASPPPGDPPPSTPPKQPPPGGRPPPNVRNVAELKLLRAMQADVNRKTDELEKLHAMPELLEAQRLQLAKEQGTIAELAIKMVKAAMKKPSAPEPAAPPATEASPEDSLKQLDDALLPSLEK